MIDVDTTILAINNRIIELKTTLMKPISPGLKHSLENSLKIGEEVLKGLYNRRMLDEKEKRQKTC